MKCRILAISLALWCLTAGLQTGFCSSKPAAISPCRLIAPEKVFSVFPTLQKLEEQKVGSTTVCNYLDKFGIPAMIVSLSQAGNHAQDSLTLLGSGYIIEDVPGLGEEAALAIQQANPQFGLQEGVTALHIKTGDVSLNLDFPRLTIPARGVELDKAKSLAADMLKNL
jgi:hypothetical protein